MSKFSRGDLVTVDWYDEKRLGFVQVPWTEHMSHRTGIPLVKVIVLDTGDVVYLDEDEIELALDEYEFVAVVVDLEDWGQIRLGKWGSYGAAQKDAVYAVAEEDSEEYKATHMIQINRRRKAGNTIGFEAFRW